MCPLEIPDKFLHTTAHFWVSFGVDLNNLNLSFIWTVPFISSYVIIIIVITPTMCVSQIIISTPSATPSSTSMTKAVLPSAPGSAPPPVLSLRVLNFHWHGKLKGINEANIHIACAVRSRRDARKFTSAVSLPHKSSGWWDDWLLHRGLELRRPIWMRPKWCGWI